MITLVMEPLPARYVILLQIQQSLIGYDTMMEHTRITATDTYAQICVVTHVSILICNTNTFKLYSLVNPAHMLT
jgi:hypothetical protein